MKGNKVKRVATESVNFYCTPKEKERLHRMVENSEQPTISAYIKHWLFYKRRKR